jgi:ABC-type sugar transport system permease subunit/ABC-type glycerol-3-phosphate transport system substrate-binding protein
VRPRALARILLLALGLAATTRAAPVTLDIPVFEGGYGISFYVDAARAFEAERPNIRVHLYGDPRVQDQLRIRIIDGDYPDAAWVPYVLWPTLIREGKAVDLAPALAGPNWEGDAAWGSTFQAGALDGWRMGKSVYGIPFGYACWGLFINRGMFREHGWPEPRTWDEFFALCARIRASGIAPLSLPGTRWLYGDAFFRASVHGLAGDAGWRDLTSWKPGAWNSPAVLESAQLLRRVTATCAQPGWEGETAQGAELLFLEGRAAMTVSGSWFFNEMAGRFPPGFEVGTLNFPVHPGGRADPTAVQTGTDCFFAFHTGVPEREAATVDFLRFLTSRRMAEAFVRRTDAPVAVKGVPDAAYSPRLRETAALIAGARDSYAMPQEMMMPAIVRQARVDLTRQLMAGTLDPAAYGPRIEAAAAEDRERAAQPDHVEVRHGVAATVLLVTVGGVALALVVLGTRSRKAPPEGFGKLGAPQAAAFVGPAFALYAAAMLVPSAVALLWSFTRWDGIGSRSWAGLLNFRALLLESDAFWQALANNAYLMVVPALIVVPLSLLFALLIHRGVWGSGAFRAILLFPNLLGGIAAILIWLNAYQPHGGLVNASLVSAGHLLHWPWLASFADFPWLSERHLYLALIPIYAWVGCGFNMVLYLAAMEGIDPQLYEAAEIDGAPAWRQFVDITLPLIRDVLAISAVFLVIAGLNAFEMVWLLTSQDPSASVQTLGTLLVTTLFKNLDIGRAAALAVILCALVFAGSAAVMRVVRRQEADA